MLYAIQALLIVFLIGALARELLRRRAKPDAMPRAVKDAPFVFESHADGG